MSVQDETETAVPRLAAAPIADDIGLLLAKLHAVGSPLNNRTLAEFGLRERSYSVLRLACSGMEPTQRELADFLSLDPSQIVALVDELETRGLVEREQGRTDRRQKIVLATRDGERLHTRAEAAVKVSEASLLSSLTAEEARTLRRLLRKALWG
ncbi:ranscriptional regulator [Sinomonas cellulolyticus]|uniref:MarR family transcriptional regulator n=1 Tax=Sinomonas cellulolyticus TaxID=2801916 RepID=A0ABS1K3D3_9MICC|nr:MULTISPECIES: MarR family transcriptional regulator [Sinomonas]MBL0706030.1 MarR family transcriptional regulator [Sinomonas cellulolyticus]GHG43132.1 ranscriptional regulator [Sinomonas sp. KCTC 49339]